MGETKHYQVYFESDLGFEDFQEIEAKTEQDAREKFLDLDIHDGEIEKVEFAYSIDTDSLNKIEDTSN